MTYDVFISYRRGKGFLMAQVIRNRLEGKGLHCFLDLEELRSGHFDVKIFNAIQEAPVFILVLSRNALNRCADENDWVRKEIMEAFAQNKTIIPVMLDGFQWPKKWDGGVPEEIRQLSTLNCVPGTQDYLSAMIDKIVSYMPSQLREKVITVEGGSRFALPISTGMFFRKSMSLYPEIEGVDMAFHAGSDWRWDSEKLDILKEITERKLVLRILANTSEIVRPVVNYMSQPLKRYVGFEESLKEWTDLAKMYPDCISVRISCVPLMHRLYIIRGTKGGTVNIKYYTYGNGTPEKDFRIAFRSGSPEYDLYVNEFDYLWENSKEISLKK